MEKMTSLDQTKAIIENNQLVFLYISQKNCSVCHGLKPQVEKILSQYPEIKTIEIDALETPAVAGEYSVFTVPVLLLFFEGQEYLRRARIVQTNEFAGELAKIVEGVRSIPVEEGE